MSRQKKISLLIGCLAGIIIAMVLLTDVILQSRAVQTFLLNRINESIPGQISWETVSTSLFSGEIHIRKIQLHDSNQKKLLQIPELSVNLSWNHLFQKELYISSVQFQDTVADLALSDQGTLNIVSAFVSDSPDEPSTVSGTFPLNIRIGQFLFRNGILSFETDDQDIAASVSGLDLAVSNFDLAKQSAHLTSTIQKGTIRQKETLVDISSFLLQAHLAGDSLSDILLKISMNGSDTEIRGNIGHVFALPILDLSIHTTLDVKAVKPFFSIQDDYAGPARLELSVKGTPDNPDMIFNMTYGPGILMNHPMDTVILKSTLNDRRLTILPSRIESEFGDLSLDGTIDLRNVFPEGFLNSTPDMDQILFEVNAHHRQTDLKKIPGTDGNLKGSVSSVFNLKGKGGVPGKIQADLRADMELNQLSYQNAYIPTEARVRVISSLENDLLTIHSLGIHTPDMDISGQGRLDMQGFEPASMDVSGQVHIETEDAAFLEHVTGVSTRGKIRLTADISGPLLSPQIVLDAAGKELKLDQFHPGSLTLDAILSPDGIVTVRKALVEQKGSVVEARGRLELFENGFNPKADPSMDLDMVINTVGIKDFLPDLDVEGILDGTMNLAGSMTAPSVRATINGKSLSFEKTRIGDFKSELTFSKGLLTIKQGEIQNKNSRLGLSGQIMLLNPDTLLIEEQPDINLIFSADTIFLEDFFDDMTGKISINGMIEGNPEQHRGKIVIQGDRLEIYRQPLEHVSGHAAIRNKEIQIQNLDVYVAGKDGVHASGKISLPDETMEIRMTATDFDLAGLDPIQKKGLQSAKLSMEVTAHGRIDDPLLDGHIFIKDIEIFDEKADPIDLTLELKNHQLQFKGKAGPEIKGMYHLDSKAFAAVLSMDAFSLAPYFKLAGQPDFSGNITGKINAEGFSDKLDDMMISAEISHVAISRDQESLFKVHPTTASYDKGYLILPGVRVDFERGGSVMIDGQGSLGRELDFKAAGSVPFDIIRSLVETVETATGNINIDATLTGDINNPLFNADLTFDDLVMGVETLEQEFNHLSGHIQFTPQKIEIVRFTGQLDKGRFELGGGAEFKAGRVADFDFKFDAQQLFLDFPGLMELMLNSSLKLSGNPEKSDLTGEIVLLEGRYYRDVELDLIGAVKQRTRKTAPSVEKSGNPFFEQMGLNVYIHRREPLLVENNLASLQVSPDLVIRGNGSNPLLSGRAKVDSGTISINKSEFEVKKGIIDFVNPYKNEPVLEIVGEMKIRSWIITLMVSGTPDNLDLQFSSDPSESHADIISLIAFGKTSREMGNAQGGQFSSEEFVSGLLADALQKSLQDATGVDRLKIDADNVDNSGAPGVIVTVGKDLSRQMSVSYGVGIRDGETVQRVTTYYKLMENLLMSGFQDSGGKFGGELKYRLEFR